MSVLSNASRHVLPLLLASAAPAWFALLGVGTPASLALKAGPNDGDYTVGMDPRYEISAAGATRWTTDDSGVSLPFVARDADIEVRYRLARVLPETAVVDVLLNRRPIDRFRCRGGAWVERRVEVTDFSGPLRLDIHVDSHDRSDRGLRLDWIRVEVRSGRLRPAGLAMLAPALLGLGALLLLRLGGMQPLAAAAVAGAIGVGVVVLAAADPLAAVHLSSKLFAPGLGVTAVAALVGRRGPGGSWLAPIVLLGYLAKGALMFHPGYYYIDVQGHGRYVRTYATQEGSIVARGLATQYAMGTAYPRFIAGKAYAFPYSPLYFIPFTVLAPDSGPVENALRHAGLVTVALEPVAVFAFASALGGPVLAAGSALAAALAPPLTSRLLLAMWPTLAGHLLDVLAMLAALLYLRRPGTRRLLGLAGATLAALLTYITSLLNLGAFLGLLSLLTRRRRWAIAGVLVVSASLTVVLLYADFTRLFVTEIVPALASGAHAGPAGPVTDDEASRILGALARIPFFYGWAFPALALAGLTLLLRRLDEPGRSVLLAYALSFAGFLLLRAGLPSLFRDLKEMVFVAPLVAIGTGASLESLASRGRSGKVAVALLILGLVAVSAERSAFYFESYRAAYMRVP